MILLNPFWFGSLLPRLISPVITDAEWDNATEATITFTDPNSSPQEVETVIEVSIAGSGSWSTGATAVQDATSAVVTGLDDANSYDFRAIAIGDNIVARNSLPSNVFELEAAVAGLIFDQVTGAMHGYSNARLLRTAYSGNLIEVRRSSDNTATGIGVSADELDQSALTTFTGGGNGFTRTKYDQVGSRDMVQTTNGNQPQIVVSGSVVAVSGKPYAQYDGSNDFMLTGSATPILDDDSTLFVVFESQSGTSIQDVFNEHTGTVGQFIRILSDTRATIFNQIAYRPDAGTDTRLSFTSQQPDSTKRIYVFRKTGTLIEAFDENGFVDDATIASVFGSNTALILGRLNNPAPANYFSGKIAELLIWNRALTSGEMTTVTNNIKAFYSIT
jgi:hypothetical protein